MTVSKPTSKPSSPKPVATPASSSPPSAAKATSAGELDGSAELGEAGSTRKNKDSSSPPPFTASELNDVRIRSGSKRKVVALACAALVFGGGALAVYDVASGKGASEAADSSSTHSSSDKSTSPAGAGASSEPKTAASDSQDNSKAAELVAPGFLYKKAVATLQELVKSPSRRVERLATMALARTGDEGAKARLRKLLETEESSLNRMALAYSLARAGGDEGRAVLTEGLTHDRRDVRSDASIGLLALGDEAGKGPLKRMTNLRHYKISASGHLARAGEENAKGILKRIYADKREDPETILRAAVELGRAGDASVAEYLRTTLSDGRFQVGAADALASLGDKAAIEPLTRQLDVGAMRVRAALALRRLDATPSLDSLAVALTEDDEVTRVTAAEALLILTGPKQIAERD